MLIFTNSDISNFLTCRRLWYWNYVHDFHPPEVRHGPRPLGDRVHKTLANSYSGGGADPIDYFNALSAKDIAWMEAAGKPDWELDDIYKETVTGRKLIEAYFEWVADTGADAAWKILGVEETIEAPILGGDVLLRGKTDLRFLNEETGRMGLNDFKTMARLDTGDRAGLERSYQHFVYMVIHDLTDPSAELAGDDPARIDPPPPPHVAEFWYTVLIKSRYTKVERFKIPGTGSSVPNRLVDIERICTEMINAIDIASKYPTPGRHCGWCDYRTPCLLADDDQARATEFLEDNYRVGGRLERYTDSVGI